MKYYLTTPLYYVNATPHIGHTYTTIVADTIKRFRRMKGDQVSLTTGTDEHGQKVERSARQAGWSPQEFTNRVASAFRDQWDELHIDYDTFIRTSDKHHHRTVQWLFNRCKRNGAIEKGNYTGQYCVGCELYVNEAEPNGSCPDCGRETETVTETNYFFKLSSYQEALLRLYEDEPQFIQPAARRNEVISFVKGGLKDLSISRSNLKWGIPLPESGNAEDKEQVFYVWFDALIGYMTAAGYGGENYDRETSHELWPADMHVVGKEIIRFHAVYWPAFLMAAELPLPKCVYAHGWLLFQKDKMSKSRGNVVRALPIDKVLGIESLRYYLLREIVFGQDGHFSYDSLVNRYNSDLANGLGNMVSRTLSMLHKYFDGVIPDCKADHDIAASARKSIEQTTNLFEKLEFSRGLESIWALLAKVDRHIVQRKPWELAKSTSKDDQAQLSETLYECAEVLRITSVLLYPIMPRASTHIWEQLGQTTPLDEMRLADLQWGTLSPGTKVANAVAMFPRLDVAESIDKMRELEKQALKDQAEIMGKNLPEIDLRDQKSSQIEIEDFAKIEMRVGQIKTAERVPKTDRLLHLTVDIGEPEPRSIVAGIAISYEPESLIGRKVAIIANLKPRKLRGLESNGMIIAASIENGGPSLIGFPEDAPIGARLS
jgi:methionyl-tRNA synthetase